MAHQATYHHQSGTAAEVYDRTFVPAIALPVSGPLLEVGDPRPGERVLDLACGTGLIARLAAERVGSSGSVVGVDISAEMIAVAESAASPDHARIEWREADADELPLPGGSFDLVLCQMGLMFFDDKAGALAEARRVLRSGGRLALSTPGPIQPPLEILDRALVTHINPDLGGFVRAVFSLHDPDQVAGMLRSAGFDDVVAEVRQVPLDLPSPTEFLWQYIASTPLAGPVGAAPDAARAALEADVVDQWQAFVDESGCVDMAQPMVYVRATTP